MDKGRGNGQGQQAKSQMESFDDSDGDSDHNDFDDDDDDDDDRDSQEEVPKSLEKSALSSSSVSSKRPISHHSLDAGSSAGNTGERRNKHLAHCM